MNRHKFFQKFQILNFKSFLIINAQNTFNKSLSVRSCCDGDFCSFSHKPRVFLSKGDIVSLIQNFWKLCFHRLVANLLEGWSQKAQEPHHSQQVSWGWVVLFPFFWRFFVLVIITIVDVNIFRHLHLNKAEEPMIFRKLLIVLSDDTTFFLDIGKSHSQYCTHLCKKNTKLIQNDTEFIDWNLVLLVENNINFSKCFFDICEIEFFLHCVSLINLYIRAFKTPEIYCSKILNFFI